MPEENQMYMEVLKNEIPVISEIGEEKNYKKIWCHDGLHAGMIRIVWSP